MANQAGWKFEYLYLMNGIDDNGNGWVDEACDGIDNDGDGITDPGFNGIDDNKDGVIDDPAELLMGVTPGAEYEKEVFIGSQASMPPSNSAYTIVRRPVVSPGAREVTLPAGVVIDLTTWNASTLGTGVLPERSRLPVDPFTGYVDIMIDQTGRVVTPGAGSDGGGAYGNSPLSSVPFYHFWLTEREGVVPPLFGTFSGKVGRSWSYTGDGQERSRTDIQSRAGVHQPEPEATGTQGLSGFYLATPMPKGVANFAPPAGSKYLTGERRLVTLFVKTGQIVTNSIQNFSPTDANYPFYDAQAGIKEPQ